MALIDVETNSGVPGLTSMGSKTIGGILNETVPLLIGIAGFILLIYLVIGGFGIMTSKGDPKNVEAAKAKITTAITGFVIIAIGYLLVQLVGLIFGAGNFEGIFG